MSMFGKGCIAALSFTRKEQSYQQNYGGLGCKVINWDSAGRIYLCVPAKQTWTWEAV